MEFPADLKYTPDHEWIKVIEGETSDGHPVAKVGITDYAQSELGELVYVEVETVDEVLAQNEEFGTVEAVKTTSELYMPVSGKVLAFNPKLSADEEDNPELVNESPYGDGWIIKIEVHQPEELKALMGAEEYKQEI